MNNIVDKIPSGIPAIRPNSSNVDANCSESWFSSMLASYRQDSKVMIFTRKTGVFLSEVDSND